MTKKPKQTGKDPEAPDDAPEQPVPDDAALRELAATVEAIVFSTDAPVSPAKIVQIGELPGRREVKQAIADLNRRYEQIGCTFRIESIAGGYQMQTLPEYHDVVSRLFRVKGESRLSQAALETLSIVAYRQPVLRADVEAIRGVACGEVLRGLMEKQLVKIVGRAEVLGRPMLYGTTRRFLEVFGLNSLKDLPNAGELRRATADSAEAPADADAEGDAVEQQQDATTAAEPAEPPVSEEPPPS